MSFESKEHGALRGTFMTRKFITLFPISVLLALLITIGCGSSVQTPTVQATIASVIATNSSVPTPTPNLTETPAALPTCASSFTASPTLAPTPNPTIPLQGVHGVPYPSADLLAGRKPDALTYIVKRVKFAQSQDFSSIRIWSSDAITAKPILAARYDKKANGWRWKEFGLGDLADALGMTFGIAVSSRPGELNSPADRALIAREASLIVPENGFVWKYTRPSPEQFYWARTDRVVDFATQNGKSIRAHPVIDSAAPRMPRWLLQEVAHDRQSLAANPNDLVLRQKIRSEYLELLITYIKTIMTRYKDRIAEWNILNEMFNDAGKFKTDNFWYRFIGKDYPEIAVRTAKEVDPNSVLIINDFFPQTKNSPKVRAYLKLLKGLKNKGLLRKKDGLGFQGHEHLQDPRTKETFKGIFRAVAQLGISVYITELDTADVYTNDHQTLSKQAKLYKRIVRACLELNDEFNRPVCRSITTWGYKDNDSWLLSEDPKPSYPLLFSANLEKKPDYDAIFAAFLENVMK
jgi:endo-1,4-beta-xylanase